MATVAGVSEAAAVPVRASCPDMARLRAEAKQLQEKLRLSRLHARDHLKRERREGLRQNHANDFEHFFQRKLLRNSLRIARHIAEHGCEELGKER